MGILGWIVFGLIVGLLARAIMPGRDSMGLIATSVLGIVGALLAGWIGYGLGWYERDSGAGLIASVVGAFVALWIYNGVVRSRRGRNTINRNDRDRFAA
ncbi:MAG: GlsB/YeaQ/YmgE family stress response membrane protein [Bdellovibrionota bacterium]